MNPSYDTPVKDKIAVPSATNAGLEQAFAQINQRLDKIEKATGADKLDEGKHSSRLAIAGAFALAGWKVMGFFAAKLGLIFVDIPRAYARGGFEGVAELGGWIFSKMLGEPTKTPLGVLYKGSLVAGAVGSFIGPVVGAWIGYSRGDRLDKATDLFTHPIDSMKKIFGPAPKRETKLTQQPMNAPKPSAGVERQHEGTVVAASQTKEL